MTVITDSRGNIQVWYKPDRECYSPEEWEEIMSYSPVVYTCSKSGVAVREDVVESSHRWFLIDCPGMKDRYLDFFKKRKNSSTKNKDKFFDELISKSLNERLKDCLGVLEEVKEEREKARDVLKVWSFLKYQQEQDSVFPLVDFVETKEGIEKELEEFFDDKIKKSEEKLQELEEEYVKFDGWVNAVKDCIAKRVEG